MLYLDDLAVWVRTQKGTIVRDVLCAICAIIAAVIVLVEWSNISKLDETITANTVTLQEKEYAKTSVEDKIESEQIVDVGLTITPKEAANNGGCNAEAIAVCQSVFGNDTRQLIQADAIARRENAKDQLSNYIANGQIFDAWFDCDYSNYQWTFLNNTTYIIGDKGKSIPAVYQCNMGNNVVVAVTTGEFDTDTRRLGNLKIYASKAGRKLQAGDDSYFTNNGIFDSIGPSEFYSTYIKPVLFDNGDSELTDSNTVSDNDIYTDVITNPLVDDDDESIDLPTTSTDGDDDADENTDSDEDVLDSIIGNLGGAN